MHWAKRAKTTSTLSHYIVLLLVARMDSASITKAQCVQLSLGRCVSALSTRRDDASSHLVLRMKIFTNRHSPGRSIRKHIPSNPLIDILKRGRRASRIEMIPAILAIPVS